MANLTPQQLQDYGKYLAAFKIANNSLVSESRYLSDFSENGAGTISERQFALAAANVIDGEINTLRSTHAVVVSRFQSGVNPPDSATVDRANLLAQDLAVHLKSAALSASLLSLVSTFISAWAQL